MPLKQGASGRRKSEIFPSSNLSMVPSSPTILITDFSPFTTEEAPVQVPILVSKTQFIINKPRPSDEHNQVSNAMMCDDK